ncbi:ketopantoate reductase family protein [Paenibacillus aestuarii]|uniref:2-dehydropantoate 2-reductase n=1 Tax=Paenibacillus aestuarii TaxID=516965 RepID=A0ABW0KCA5_9BACL|nr:2-dehydropantoate 2-reductase [Paenibacillus aestuarii]
MMHIMIVGAGSLGLLFAAKLSECSHRLTIVTRTKDQAQALQEHGIVLDGTRMAARNIVVESFEDGQAGSGGDPDFIFLMVKQTAITDELIAGVKSLMAAKTVLVCFQNGIGHEQRLGSAVGSDKLLLAVTTEAARKEGSNAVSHTGKGITYIGAIEAAGHEPVPEGLQILLTDLMEKAGVSAEMSKNMVMRIWTKLLINAVINPLTAILRVKNGDLLRSPSTIALMRDLFDEAMLLAAAKQISLPEDLWETIQHVCKATARNHSSMLQDVMLKRNTEIDSMNGSLLRLAEALQIELPIHRTVYRLVKALEE